MASFFPGMDPYLEISGDWRDFHSRALNAIADALSGRLPEGYIARIEEEFHILEYPQETLQRRIPDVSISRTGRAVTTAGPSHGTATLEPQSIELATTIVEEVKQRWIEIRRKPDWVPVAILELLSPSHKIGHGYEEYLYKRVSMIARSIHLIEVDLLLGGRRLPMARPLPPGDYHVFVSRTEGRPLSDVYSWSIRDRLPTIPIPLVSPDPDILLDLAEIFTAVYERGRYDRSIDYQVPLALPLGASDRSWAEALARTDSVDPGSELASRTGGPD
jgi:Protein of unknown function (DUF4058)